MKKAYQYPITIAIQFNAMSVLMASPDVAGGSPEDYPGDFAPGRNKPF